MTAPGDDLPPLTRAARSPSNVRRRAVFFDAGHTLVEPVVSVPEVYLREAYALGIEIPAADFGNRLKAMWLRLVRDYRSAPDELVSSEELERDAWRRFTRHLAEPYPALAAVHADWVERLFVHFDDPAAWRPAPGAMKLLHDLAEQDVVIGVVSNWHAALHGILGRHGILDYCRFVLTSAEIGRKKPHPYIFERALEHAGIAASDTVHIGDSWCDDVQGALGVGIRPILLAAFPEAVPADVPDHLQVIESLERLTAAELL